MYCESCGVPVEEGIKFCPECGRPRSPLASSSKLESRTPSEAPPATKRSMGRTARISYTVLALVLGAAFTWTFWTNLPGGAHPVIIDQPEISVASSEYVETQTLIPISVVIENASLNFPLSLLREHKMLEFEYTYEGTTVPLMAYLTSSGKIVTSVRMCEPCNSKSFRIEGKEMACGNCETRWKLDNLEGIQGACQKYPPDPIPSQVIDGRVVISEATIRKWKLRI